MPNEVATRGPGVYPGTPMQEYHGWDAASNSRLSRLAKSPAHLLAYMQQPLDAASLALGRAIHSAVLEPDDFKARYILAGPCLATLKSGTRKGEPCNSAGSAFHSEHGWLCGTHVKGMEDGTNSSRLVLSPDDYAACMGIRDSAQRMETTRTLLSGSGEVELSMLWNDPETDVLCKARWDRHSPDVPGGAIIDIKSTRDASRRHFERSIFTYRYHCQGGLYMESAQVRRLPARHYVIIAAEKTPPYAVAPYRLTEGALDAGMEQNRPLLRLYAKCMATGEWPAYPDVVQDIALPSYAWSQIDEELQEVAA